MRECRYVIGTSLTGTQGTRQEAASDIYKSLFYPGTFVREYKRSIRNQTFVDQFGIRGPITEIRIISTQCWQALHRIRPQNIAILV